MSVFLHYHGLYTLAHALKVFSKSPCKSKPLLVVSSYEVLLPFYFSLSLFLFFLAKCELLSLHVEQRGMLEKSMGIENLHVWVYS